MARYCDAVCRLCRREGEKLFLKGERCFSNKCAVERRDAPPGQHGKGKQSKSDYKVQLREKQKLKRMYGMLEKQFRTSFVKASNVGGVTGTEMLIRLERRLDNVIYKLGIGSSRSKSRQCITHGKVKVNGRKVNIPSYLCQVGDVVQVDKKFLDTLEVQASIAAATSRNVPSWLSIDVAAGTGVVNGFPTRQEMPQSINEQLVVELYSK